jgi:hypothetical protein
MIQELKKDKFRYYEFLLERATECHRMHRVRRESSVKLKLECASFSERHLEVRDPFMEPDLLRLIISLKTFPRKLCFAGVMENVIVGKTAQRNFSYINRWRIFPFETLFCPHLDLIVTLL